MAKIVLLDAGPLGAVTHPRANKNKDIKEWLQRLLRSGVAVRVPEIADYEIRRELVRAAKSKGIPAAKSKGIQRLDDLKQLGYIPLTTEVMLKAAEFWAFARQQGQPTADNKELDADVILAAQAIVMGSAGDDVVIATTNVGHLA